MRPIGDWGEGIVLERRRVGRNGAIEVWRIATGHPPVIHEAVCQGRYRALHVRRGGGPRSASSHDAGRQQVFDGRTSTTGSGGTVPIRRARFGCHCMGATKVVMGRAGGAMVLEPFQEFRCWYRGWRVCHATVALVVVVVMCCANRAHSRCRTPSKIKTTAL